jgi:5-formyltetrahydrofolate cyclo-ligase
MADDASSIASKKSGLRQHLRSTLANLSDEKILEGGRIVAGQLFTLPQYKSSRAIACFVSMPKEFNTAPILEGIFRDGKDCFLPRVESIKDRQMVLLRAESLASIAAWPKTKWGIPEPPRDGPALPEALDEDTVDLYVVPGLAFDRAGGRLGQGAGFYDRYLARALEGRRARGLPPPLLVGVTLDELLVEEVPCDAHDLRMDVVLYPSKADGAP